MGSFGPKQVAALSPSVVLALWGVWLITFRGRLVDGVVIISVAALWVAAVYLALMLRNTLHAQQRLGRRLARVEAQNKRVISSANRSLKQIETAEARGEQRAIRLEKLILGQQQEVTDALTDVARRQLPGADLDQRLSGIESLAENLRISTADALQHLLAIKRHLNAIEDGEHGGSLRRNLDADIAALIAINRQVAGSASLPVPSKWALSPQVLELTLRLIRNHPEIDLVVELGSGASTAWIGELLRARSQGRLISFEHDERFLAATREAVTGAGAQESVELRLAPLVDVEMGDETYQWYEYSGDLDDVGLLLVDGPPGATGPTARYPAWPVFQPALRDGAFVILDDAVRPDEKEILDRWLQFDSDGVTLSLIEIVDRAALLRVSRKS